MTSLARSPTTTIKLRFFSCSSSISTLDYAAEASGRYTCMPLRIRAGMRESLYHGPRSVLKLYATGSRGTYTALRGIVICLLPEPPTSPRPKLPSVNQPRRFPHNNILKASFKEVFKIRTGNGAESPWAELLSSYS